MFGNDSRSDGSFGRVYRTIVENDSHPAINRPSVAIGCCWMPFEFKDQHLAFPGRLSPKNLQYDSTRL